MVPDLIIVGSSVRAAAMSAIRSGFHPWCIDLFCDSDLRAVAPAFRCPPEAYPQGMVSLFREAPEVPWIYTGGLENYPNLIRELANLRPLWGNGVNTLLKCRSPFFVTELLKEAGLPSLEVRHADAELPSYCRWLRKPIRSAGGNGIEFAWSRLSQEEAKTSSMYHQQFVDGESYSATLIGDGREATFYGVTRQLIGIRWLNAKPFQYCGNVGPIEIGPELKEQLQQIGNVLTKGCELKGLFGIDWILHGNKPYVVEVNPRYTSSMELVEFGNHHSLLKYHASVFERNELVPTSGFPLSTIGKLIVYTSKRIVLGLEEDSLFERWLLKREINDDRRVWMLNNFGDIPGEGEIIDAGWPVYTRYFSGASLEQCQSQIDTWRDWLIRCQERYRKRQDPASGEANEKS